MKSKKKDWRCRLKKCRYHAGGVWAAESGTCRYWEITGHTKLGQLSPEERRALIKGEIKCPFYEQGPKVRKPRERNNAIFASKGVVRARAAGARYRELYRRGLNDHEIGQALGVTPGAVRHWRWKEGLPANCGTGRPGRRPDGRDLKRPYAEAGGEAEKEVRWNEDPGGEEVLPVRRPDPVGAGADEAH